MGGFQEISRAYAEAAGNIAKSFPPLGDALQHSKSAARKSSEIAFMAARRNIEISSSWASETIDNLGEAAKARDTKFQYAKATAGYASSSAASFANMIGAYGDLAISIQSEALRYFLQPRESSADPDPLTPGAETVQADSEARAESPEQ